MKEHDYELVDNDYDDPSSVPRDDGLFYHCTDCGDVVPSVPDDNVVCRCGNVFIDKECWRLIVADMDNFEVLRKRIW